MERRRPYAGVRVMRLPVRWQAGQWKVALRWRPVLLAGEVKILPADPWRAPWRRRRPVSAALPGGVRPAMMSLRTLDGPATNAPGGWSMRRQWVLL